MSKVAHKELVSSGGIGVVPVRIKMPQVQKAECILEIVARDSGEERESEVKRGVQSMIGTWLIFYHRADS